MLFTWPQTFLQVKHYITGVPLKTICSIIRSIRRRTWWVCICNSRVKRLQLQMRGLLRRLVAIWVKATNEINFRRERERERRDDIIPLSLKSVFYFFFTKFCVSRSDSILTWKSIKASDGMIVLSEYLYNTRCGIRICRGALIHRLSHCFYVTDTLF